MSAISRYGDFIVNFTEQMSYLLGATLAILKPTGEDSQACAKLYAKTILNLYRQTLPIDDDSALSPDSSDDASSDTRCQYDQ